MKNFSKKLLVLLGLSLFSIIVIKGQERTNPISKGVKYNFTEDGKYSFKFGFGTQFWARYTEQNPNTFDWNGESVDQHFDFLIRRSFLKLQTNLDRFFMLSILGVKSQTQLDAYLPFTKSNPKLFFFDMFANYSFFDKHLYVGYGLHLYHGLSRYASASSLYTLAADVPMIGAPNVFSTEQYGRNLGMFIDGLAGSFGYRLVLATPFVTDSKSKPGIGIDKAADVTTKSMKMEGYFTFQFFDKEIKPVPYSVGTYVGRKKILNLGAGFKYHPQSTASLDNTGDTIFYNQLHLATDIFMELPFENNSALTLYAGYFLFDFGPNYLLSGGYANTFKASSPRGAGNSEPMCGTGSALATQAAWLFPYRIGKSGVIQTFYEGTYRFFDALDDSAMQHSFGVNYFIFDHNAKITLQYNIRPYFEGLKHESYKNQFILKLQLAI